MAAASHGGSHIINGGRFNWWHWLGFSHRFFITFLVHGLKGQPPPPPFANQSYQILIARNALLEAEAILGEKIVTPILEVSKFFTAEKYHQDYYKGENLVLTRFGPIKQKNAYKRYRSACGRDERLKEVWGKDAFLN